MKPRVLTPGLPGIVFEFYPEMCTREFDLSVTEYEHTGLGLCRGVASSVGKRLSFFEKTGTL